MLKKTQSLVKQVVLGLSTSFILSLVSGNQPVTLAEELNGDPATSSSSDLGSLQPANPNLETVPSDTIMGNGEEGILDSGDETEVNDQSASSDSGSDSESDETEANDTSDGAQMTPNIDPESKEEATIQKDASTSQVSDNSVTLDQDRINMTEKTIITEKIENVGDIDPSSLHWTLNKKDLENFKTYNMDSGEFDGDPFITIDKQRVDHQTFTFDITINSLFGRDLSLRTPNNIRRTYQDFIGSYELLGRNEAGLTIRKELILRPYEKYMSYDEMKEDIQATIDQAAPDRYISLESYGRSAQGRDIPYGIIASQSEDIDNYLHNLSPRMLKNPDQIKDLLNKGDLTYKLPILIHNTHADEQPGIDIVRNLYKDFATKDEVSFDTLDDEGKPTTITMKVKDILSKAILLFSFTENPDGYLANSRQLANHLDPNRDTGYQTNPETQAITGLINQWNPISILDFHGFIEDFLIEPTTPPHDPNFEYDLTADTMMENAKAMGNAGVANSGYNHYIIPKIDYGSGWDDAFSGYTAVYGLYHGIMGHTIEIPETNYMSFRAGYYAGLGGIHYLTNNLDRLMGNRLDFYARGIHKIEDSKAEAELVGPKGEIVGRPKGDKDRFFPDYYVIPMSLAHNRDSQAAFDMINYLKHNGVEVKELTQDSAGYHKGDLVIDMAQAKRGYANHVLYQGSNESAWDAMYAELVVNFPMMRGFQADPIYQADLFKDLLGQVTHQKAPRSQVTDAPYYWVANNSVSTIQAVNAAIRQGHKVYASQDGFIMDKESLSQALDSYALLARPLYKEPLGQALSLKKIYIPKDFQAWIGFKTLMDSQLVTQSLGYEIVDSLEEADVLILQNDQFTENDLGKKPTIIVGGLAMDHLEKLGVISDFDAEMFKNGSANEGLIKAIINKNSNLSSGYALKDLFYSNSGSWINKLPQGFKTIAEIANENYFISGWWPGYDQLAGKIVAIDGNYNDQPLFVYAGNPSNRQHTHYFYRWLANAIFRAEPAYLVDIRPGNQSSSDLPVDKPNQPKPEHHNGTTEQTIGDSSLDTIDSSKVAPKHTDEKILPEDRETKDKLSEKTSQANQIDLTSHDSQETSLNEADSKEVMDKTVIEDASHSDSLPETGETEATFFIIQSILISLGSCLLLFRKDPE